MDTKTGIEFPATEPLNKAGSRFVGVVPIARAVAAEHLVIVLVALERFDTYLNLAMQVFLAANHPRANPEPGGHTSWPTPILTATDDLGTKYRAEPGGGNGGNQHYRLECALAPAIPEGAEVVSIVLEGVDWKDLDNGQQSESASGRWRFDVDLTHQVDATLVPPSA